MRYKKIECDFKLEQIFTPIQKRKDSSFHTKDKSDYSVLREKNMRRDSIIK